MSYVINNKVNRFFVFLAMFIPILVFSQNVGVGTTSPSATFHVDGTFKISAGVPAGTFEKLNVDYDVGGDTYMLIKDGNQITDFQFKTEGDSYLNGNGNVGVGTTSPLARLHIDKNGNEVLRLEGLYPFLSLYSGATKMAEMQSTASQTLLFYNYGNGGMSYRNTGGIKFLIEDGGNVGISTTTPSQRLHVSGNMRLTGGLYDGSNLDGTSGQILSSTGSATQWVDASSLVADGDWTISGSDMYSTPLGNVGVGSTSPLAKLHVKGSGNSSGSDAVVVENSNGDEILKIRDDGVIMVADNTDFRIQSESWGGFRLLGEQGATPDKPSIGFYSDNGIDDGGGGMGIYRPEANEMAFSTLSLERIRINPSGNLGISTTSPSQKLHVSGNMRLTGGLYDGSNLDGTSGQILSSTGSATQWVDASSISSDGDWTISGSDMYSAPSGNVGIGQSSPSVIFETYDDNTSNQNKLTNTKRIDGVFTSSAHVAQLKDYASDWGSTTSGETVSSAVYIEAQTNIKDLFYENRPSAALYTFADYFLQDNTTRIVRGRTEVMTSMSKVHNSEQWLYGIYAYSQLVPDGMGAAVGNNQEDKVCAVEGIVSTDGTVTGDATTTEMIGLRSRAIGTLNNGKAYGVKIQNRVSGTNNNYGIYIETTSGATTNNDIYAESGALLTTGGVWTDASDRKKKKNIRGIEYGLNEVLALEPVQYKLRINNRKDIGFIAQDLKKVIPEIVYGKEGDMSLSYGQLTSVLTKAIQEQQKIIDAQNLDINTLKTEVEALRNIKAENKNIMYQLEQLNLRLEGPSSKNGLK